MNISMSLLKHKEVLDDRMCSLKLVAMSPAFSLSDLFPDWKPAGRFICTCLDASRRLTKHCVL